VNVVDPITKILRDVDGGDDFIAGGEALELGGIMNGVIHGHGVHPPFDFLAVDDCHLAGDVNANDGSMEFVVLCGLLVTAGSDTQYGEKADEAHLFIGSFIREHVFDGPEEVVNAFVDIGS
jgi:hypothetical protein